ncbi:MAG: HAMP domain-containing sensor histidine kinase [bacterium]
MKTRHFRIHPVLVFVLAQLAWLFLLGIWIYWYVTNYIILNKVGDRLSPQIVPKSTNVVALVTGLVLLVAILVSMYLIFIYLNRQLSLTKLYDNFIGNVTHELKSSLASIQLYLETMDSRDVPCERQKEFIGFMMKDANRLHNLINSILQISGIEQRKVAYTYRVCTAEDVVRSLLDEAKEQFKLPESAIQIEGNVPCPCVVDRDALKIVFDNLIDNAIKYTTGPVHITLHLGCTSKNIVIRFRDRGIGISPREQKKVFDKFHRVYDKDIPNVKGTGLGLYWVKEIIRTHGGGISVFSEGKGRGTTFGIELPIYEESRKRYTKHLLKITQKRRERLHVDVERESV